MKKKNGQGHKPVVPLRFSKSNDPDIERWYGTHFVDSKRMEQLKAEKENSNFPFVYLLLAKARHILSIY